jgi:tetratricopeptide (TPR) repeat protein
LVYTLVDLLPNQGAWSQTWLAEDKGRNKVVIKTPNDNVFTPQYANVREQYLDLFEKEAVAIRDCDHESIVKLKEKFCLTEENERPCIVLDYVAGISVWDRIGISGVMSEKEALAYIGQIGDALSWMHENNYLHHDVKPSNIMIREITLYESECQAVLMDFGGASRFVQDDNRSYYEKFGTVGFVAPEVIQAYDYMKMEDLEKFYLKQSAKLDVYSLAATLYYMLSGKTPPVRKNRRLSDDISQKVKDAIDKGLQASENRSESVDEWLDLLPLVNKPLYFINGILTYELITWDVVGDRLVRIKRNALKLVESGFEKEQAFDYKGAVGDYSQSISLDSNCILAYARRGQTLFLNMNEKSLANEDFQAAVSLPPETSEDYTGRGIAKHYLQDNQGAIADFTEAICLNPSYALAYNSRGNMKSALGDKEGAIADYNEAIRLNPSYASAYYNRGNAKSALGDKEGAIADYNESIHLNPNDAKVYHNRGGAKYDLGYKEGAITDCNEAIRLDPNYDSAYNSRGVVKSALGDKEGAIADYNEAIHLDPNYDSAYYSRGVVKYDLGDKEGAIADYNEAIRLDPNDAKVYLLRSLAKYDLGDKEGAITDSNEAIQLNSDYADAYYHRGLIKKERGEKQEAWADFWKASKIYQQQGNPKWYNNSRDRIIELLG